MLNVTDLVYYLHFKTENSEYELFKDKPGELKHVPYDYTDRLLHHYLQNDQISSLFKETIFKILKKKTTTIFLIYVNFRIFLLLNNNLNDRPRKTLAPSIGVTAL